LADVELKTEHLRSRVTDIGVIKEPRRDPRRASAAAELRGTSRRALPNDPGLRRGHGRGLARLEAPRGTPPRTSGPLLASEETTCDPLARVQAPLRHLRRTSLLLLPKEHSEPEDRRCPFGDPLTRPLRRLGTPKDLSARTSHDQEPPGPSIEG
jgi:hypothetical protein